MLKQREGEGEGEKKRIFLPEEILLEVFAQLPTKSVMRIRAVSNNLCKITKEKYFVDLHYEKMYSTLRSKQAPLFFTSRGIDDETSMIGFCLQEGGERSRKNTTVSSYTLPFRAVNHNGWPDGRDFAFACSCNGLVCIRPEDGRKPVIVCNPLTLESTTLPSYSFRYVGLGLGYGPSTKEYKVACLAYEDPDCYYFNSQGKLMVYNLGSGRDTDTDTPWRKVGRVPLFVSMKPPVYADGHICWLLLDRNRDTSYLLFYNVDTDQVQLFTWNLPAGVASSRTNFDRMLLVELEGRVSLAFHDDASVEIWMLTDRRDCWIRRHKIRTSPPPPPNKLLMIRNYNLPWMIAIWEREEGLQIWFQDRIILLYDQKNVNDDHDVKFEEYEAPDLGDHEPNWRSCPNYRPSLVSLQQYYKCNTGEKSSYDRTQWAEPPPKIPLPPAAKPLIRRHRTSMGGMTDVKFQARRF